MTEEGYLNFMSKLSYCMWRCTLLDKSRIGKNEYNYKFENRQWETLEERAQRM